MTLLDLRLPYGEDPLEDRNILLGFLFSHKKALIANQFARFGVPLLARATKPSMRRAVEMKLDSGELTVRNVRDALIGLEGWGRQQIYLFDYKGGETLRNQWLGKDWVEEQFRECGFGRFLNKTRRISPESEYQLFTISHDANEGRIRFVWVQNRTSFQRLELEDPPPPDFKLNDDFSAIERTVLRAYREKVERDVSSFEWDIKRSDAMIMIRKLRGTKYKNERRRLLSILKEILPVADYQAISVSRLIENLRGVDEVELRNLDFRLLSDAKARLQMSIGSDGDLRSNPQFIQILEDHWGDLAGRKAPVRWKIGERQIGMDLYAAKDDDHRISINSQEAEEDVRLLLRRVRKHC